MYLNKSLKSFNSFGVESSAAKYVRIENIEQLKKILNNNKKVKKIVLGGGSNILFTKKFNGLCIHMQNRIEIKVKLKIMLLLKLIQVKIGIILYVVCKRFWRS